MEAEHMFDVVDPRFLSDKSLLKRINPVGQRIVVNRPEIAAPYVGGYVNSAGLAIPDMAKRALKEWGLLAKILKVSPDVTDDMLVPGSIVLIAEYAGIPLYLGRETPYWIIGTGDVMCIVEGGDIE